MNVVHISHAKGRVRVPRKAVTHERPFASYYFDSVNHQDQGWSRVGRACSEVGAIKAAVVRLVIGQYKSAVICGIDGGVKFRLERKRGSITCFGVFFDFETYMRKLEKAKK